MRDRVWFFLSLAFVIFSLWPMFYELKNIPKVKPERYFELVHNFPTDYNFYLSRIRQGIEGNLTVTEQYTSEPHAGSFIHIMYLAMGWIGRAARVPWHRAGDVYHVARIVFGMTLLMLIGAYARQAFSLGTQNSELNDQNSTQKIKSHVPNYQLSPTNHKPHLSHEASAKWETTNLPPSNLQLLAFLLAVTAGSWPKFTTVEGWWRFGGYMPWWSVMDSLQRITFIPHLLAGQAMIIFILMTFSGAAIKKPGNWVFLGLLGLLLGIIFPPGLVFVYATLGVWGLILLFIDWGNRGNPGNKGKVKKIILSIVIFGILSFASLLYLQLMTSFYPWKRLAEQDIINPLPFDYAEYLRAVGPILPLGLIGLIIALIKKETAQLMSVAWVFAWGLLLFIFNFIPQQSPLRFSEMIPHIPLAMLTIYWLNELSQKIKLLNKKFAFPLVIGHWGLVISFILLNFLYMTSSWLWQRDFVDHKLRASFPLVPAGSYVMYPLKDFVSAIVYIQDHYSRSDIILSGKTTGNYIPVYAGNRVFIGHANTVRAEDKENQMAAFYSGDIGKAEAPLFIKAAQIRAVFYGPQEVEIAGLTDLTKRYPWLKEVYKNNFVTIYEP